MAGIFLVSSASATDLNETIISEIDSNVDNDAVSLETIEYNQEDLSINESMESKEMNLVDDPEIFSNNYTPKDSSEIQTYVDNASEGDTIILDGYYLINATVNVGKQLNFVGINDATVDGNNGVRLFNVSKSSVSFKDITFKNANATGRGGAIYGSCKATNCSFINNSADESGGAVYDVSCVNCYFADNSAKWGGAVYFNNRGSVEDCIFFNNHVDYYGGAIYFGESGWFSRVGSCMNCSFYDNSAGSGGGAVYFDGKQGSVVNCSFVNNSASQGGAVYDGSSVVNCSFVGNLATWAGGAVHGGSSVNCSFVNNSAIGSGGAVHDGSCVNCSFVNNRATSYGGAISGVSAVNCSFIKNMATSGGAVYGCSCVNCSFVNNSAIDSEGFMTYGGAMSTGSAVNCSFVSNFAVNYGGAIYDAESIVNCSFINNSAGGYGGAIRILCNSNISGCSFINSTSRYGGAIYCLGKNSINISLCNFSNCLSLNGGSYLGFDESCDYSVFDCIFDVIPEGVIYHYTVDLDVDDLVIYKGGNDYLIAKLSTKFSPLTNTEVTFTVNGIKYSRKTDSQGIIKFNIQDYITNLGEITVNLNYAGDEHNIPVSSDVGVHLKNYKGNLTVDVDGKYFNDTILNFKLINTISNAPVNRALIKVEFSNGEVYNLTTNVRGLASLAVPFNPGNYSAHIYVDESHVDVNGVDLDNIKINRIVGDIKLSTLNDNHTLVVKAFNPYNLDVYRNLKVDLDFDNGTSIALITDNEGIATYEIFEKGSYFVSATSSGEYRELNSDYLEFIITGFLNSKINFSNDIVFDFGEIGSVNFTVEGGNVHLDGMHVVNHSEAVISIKNNVITVLNLTVGNYTLVVNVAPDEYHNPVSANVSVVVNPAKSRITLTTGVVIDYGDSGSIHVAVEGGIVKRENITVVGHPEVNIEFDNGVITVSGLAVGKYTLSVVSTPDDDHYSVNRTVDLTVNEAVALIKSSSATVYYNSPNTWSVKLLNSRNNAPLANMKVTFKVYTGSKLYKSFSYNTNSNGIIDLKVSTWTVGSHKVVISFSKEGYVCKSVASYVTIKKTPVVITAPKLSVYLKDAKKWSIKVVDSKTKKAIANSKLTLKVYTGKKYKSYFVKTNSKGIATFSTSGLTVGTHKVVVSFSKTGYVSKSASSSIVVKPIPLNIKADFSFGSGGSTVRVTVTNKLTGKPANGISIKLSVYTGSKVTKAYNLITDNYKTYKGFVGFGTNAFSVGTHNVVIKPVSNMYSGQGTTSLVIKSGAAKNGKYYSFVSNGKLTLS